MSTDVPRNQILLGDCLETMRTLPSGIVQCCVTSPPYFALRSYLAPDHPDKPKEIGSEPTPDAFIRTMVGVFGGGAGRRGHRFPDARRRRAGGRAGLRARLSAVRHEGGTNQTSRQRRPARLHASDLRSHSGGCVMHAVSLITKNCIVTGKPAAAWGGHVRAKGYGAINEELRLPVGVIGVTAGFADEVTMREAKSDERGCYGDWKPADGLMLDLFMEHHILEQQAAGDFVSLRTSLLREIIEKGNRR